MLIKPEYKGRTFVRAVFFMPLIFASGIPLLVFQLDGIASTMLSGSSITGGETVTNTALNDFLVQAGISEKIISIVTRISGELFSMLWRTGLQMLIFLAGLHSIPPSLYEASAIEGSNAWDDFWKITLPMLSKLILLNVVYTIVDGFTIANNAVMKQIVNLMNQGTGKLGLSSAFAWSYCVCIAAILGVLMLVIKLASKAEGRSEK
jgi:ABC-type sugar transport system permease subunit